MDNERGAAAIAVWLEAARITQGPVFRRVNVRRYEARSVVRRRCLDMLSGHNAWKL